VVNEKSAALNGAMLQMFNHGISSAALFFLVGVIYERTHTRKLEEYGGLRKIMPIYAGILGISMFSSLGLPGLNGFVGEFLVFKGAFPIVTLVTSLATIGLVITAVFLTRHDAKGLFRPAEHEMGRSARHDRTRDLHRSGADVFHVLDRDLPGPMINASNTAVKQLVDMFQTMTVAIF
jgi:NADH:ubiquinone oxidoreductase subunit 4 (subunit M)